ncbi:helix-turn-helix transcriptional regulator [Candidatus Raskinella chloraquaticus]|uniref:HTH luxR-type domain-containing protein n=1 Tax=Candidatus Raskinella chloraquaticus TaxID=1951219 RepID=A0A1W9HPW4_9HYPH|nr:MAG: hypothetical protein A4S15_01845 [Proteobacteria bacterium SG_bin8]
MHLIRPTVEFRGSTGVPSSVSSVPTALAPPPTMAEHLRRVLELDHLHLVMMVEDETSDRSVRILFSTWSSRIQARALAAHWHFGTLATAARRARGGVLTPADMTQASLLAEAQVSVADMAELGPQWLFAVPRRAGLASEIWAGRNRPLSAIDEGLIGAIALPLLRSISQRYARLSGKPRRLTPREVECLRWASEGRTSEDIAGLLDIAQTTVETHFKHAAAKLGAQNRSHAVAEALRSGVIA